jgi:DNA helicase-2/ATP-dependent DNA helicase PcrA
MSSTMPTPTKEQQAIIDHPRGYHARVLAVAGAGKTTTMAQMILGQMRRGVSAKTIQVLMFNALARKEFIHKMTSMGISPDEQPAIDTFHSFASRVFRYAQRQGVMPDFKDNWSNEDGERERISLARIINELERSEKIPKNTIDTEMSLSAIGLWKGELVPPDRERARTSGPEALIEVFVEFEKFRVKKQAFTFDDYVPMAVHALEINQAVANQFARGLQLVVVDEYQDINYGQQRMVELIAGSHADIVVVGDDDQTIYEWRGARPDYILDHMSGALNGKPVIDYVLSQSFRFGPLLAQSAHNVISVNERRKAKPLVAFDPKKNTAVHIVEESAQQANDLSVALCDELVLVAKRTQNPAQIIVLGRSYSQMQGLESMCLIRKIPYCVVGNRPFYERTEITTLVDYLRIAQQLKKPMTQELLRLCIGILNRPNRKLNKTYIEALLEMYRRRGSSLQEALSDIVDPAQTSELKPKQIDQLTILLFALEQIFTSISKAKKVNVILTEFIEHVQYRKHYQDFYGKGEASHDRLDAISQFIGYVASLDAYVSDFIPHFDSLDSTCGVAEEDLIVFTTIYRTKGLEYDYVFIPDVMEGKMPVLGVSEMQVWDVARGNAPDTPASLAIERERRLFYVGLTRAKVCAYIGIMRLPEHGTKSGNLPEVSRFVDEMHLHQTKQIISIVVQKEGNTAETLLQKLREVGVGKAMRHQLATYLDNPDQYLQGMHDSTIREWPSIYRSNNPLKASDKSDKPKPTPVPKWYQSSDNDDE